MFGFELVLGASEPCCPTRCAMVPLEFLTKVREPNGNHGPTETRTRTYICESFVSQGNAESIYLKKKTVGKMSMKKKPPYCKNLSQITTFGGKLMTAFGSLALPDSQWEVNKLKFQKNSSQVDHG